MSFGTGVPARRAGWRAMVAGTGGQLGETREEVLEAPNLLDLFCRRTAEDFRGHGEEGSGGAPGVVLLLTAMVAVILVLAGRSSLAKAAFLLFGVEVVWAVWDVVVRSSSESTQKREEIRRGMFPPDAASLVRARLRWWDHLVAPLRWARHSRIHDRRHKLEKRIRQTRERMEALGVEEDAEEASDTFLTGLARQITNFAAREERRVRIGQIADEGGRLREELALYRALLRKTGDITDTLERIDKLRLEIADFTAADLTQVVSDALAVLDERRRLVQEVDAIDPDDFLDLITL